jgi:hypothetical protein
MLDPVIEARGPWRLGVIVTLTAMALASCSPAASSLPGTSLGTYNVTGTLESNTCGSGLGAPSPWTFTLQMSQDASILYLETSDGSQLSGPMSSSTQASITSTQTLNVDAPDAGLQGPCNLQNTSVIDLVLAATSPPATFTGTITYTFAAATGVSTTTNCTDQLSAYGGPYDTLPCSASYSVAGSRQ